MRVGGKSSPLPTDLLINTALDIYSRLSPRAQLGHKSRHLPLCGFEPQLVGGQSRTLTTFKSKLEQSCLHLLVLSIAADLGEDTASSSRLLFRRTSRSPV